MKKQGFAALLLAICMLTGCTAQPVPAQETTEPPEQAAASETNTSAVADASQMTTVEDVVEDGMTPVYATELKGGAYPITADSSSSMFKIESCELIVEADTMMAELTMSSDAYGYLFPGTAEEAAAADETRYITPYERKFMLEIDALDAGVQCAAWSRNKELWYDRTLVFRSDSLPLDAFKTLTTAESLGLADGSYTVDVTLGGGSGKASVQSPTMLTVENGEATAEIVWSSANYDYMLVDGERYDAVINGGHSEFDIPVTAFDHPLAVIADTTAMSQPYEIDYTLKFCSESIAAVEP